MQLPPNGCSAFMVSHLPEFFERFGINYAIDGPQLEYFVYEKKRNQDISCSLTVCFGETAGEIRMMTFYPGICLQHGCRFLSAVCFFLVMQHFVNFHHIETECRILINTRKGIFNTFYAMLKDFDFHITLCGEDDRVDIQSQFQPLGLDTTMISKRDLAD